MQPDLPSRRLSRSGLHRTTGGLDETDLPAEQSASEARTRLPREDGEPDGTPSDQASAAQGPQASDRLDSGQAARLSLTGKSARPGAAGPGAWTPYAPVACLQNLPKLARVRRRKDFLAIQSRARRHPTRHFLVLVARDGSPAARLGITVTRKVGNSVARNHIKRRVREAFRRRRDQLPGGYSLVVIARDGSPGLDALATALELGPVFDRLNTSVSGPAPEPTSGLPARSESAQDR